MRTEQEVQRKWQELYNRQAQAGIRKDLNIKSGLRYDIADMVIEDCKQQMRILAWVLDGKVTDEGR